MQSELNNISFPISKIKLINRTTIAKELNISPSYVSKLFKGTRISKKYEKKIKNLIKKAAEDLKTKAA